jgi:hypothetical protein
MEGIRELDFIVEGRPLSELEAEIKSLVVERGG